MTWSLNVYGHEDPNSAEAEQAIMDSSREFVSSLKANAKNVINAKFTGNFVQGEL